MVLLEDLGKKASEAATRANLVGEKICKLFGEAYVLDELICHVIPSIGLSLFPYGQPGINKLLKRTDLAMSQAKDANIPVFFIGSPLLDGMAGSVDVTSPKPINDLFVPFVKDNGITDILTLDYTPGTPCRLRKEYRDEQLAAQAPDVKATNHEFPIPGQVVDAQNTTAAWLAAHPEGSGKFAIWACFTDPTAGAVAAIKQAGRTDDIPIYTWDFNKTILDPLKSGQVAATLSLDGNAVGSQVATLIDDYFANGTPQGVPAANMILTAETIDDYLA